MIRGNKTKKYIFSMAFPLLLFGSQTSVVAGVFSDPADNSYSLKKVFVRPFLQNFPIPQVWQTDSKSEKFKQDWLDAMTPKTPAEKQMESLAWQLPALDERRSFNMIARENPVSDWSGISKIVIDLIPIVDLAGEKASLDQDKKDALYNKRRIKDAEKEKNLLDLNLLDLRAFWRVLDQTARTDFELLMLKNELKDADQKTNRLFQQINRALLSTEILEKAQDIYSMETRQIKGLNEIDDVFNSLLVNDMLDLSTGLYMMNQDDMLSDFSIDSPYRSASLLDRKQKTDHSRLSDPAYRRKAFFKRLEKFLKGHNSKDVQ